MEVAHRRKQIVGRAWEQANSPGAQSGPIDRTGKTLQIGAGVTPDDPVRLAAGLESVGKAILEGAGFGRKLVSAAARTLQNLEQPWNEQHIAQPRLDCAGARKEVIGNGITDAAQAEFVTALPFLEQRHDPLRTLALGFIEINPG